MKKHAAADRPLTPAMGIYALCNALKPLMRWRLIVGIILLQAVVTTLFTSSLARERQQYLRQEFAKDAWSAIKIMAATSASWIVAANMAGLQKTLELERRLPALSYAMALSPTGKMLADSDRSLADQYASDAVGDRLWTAQTVPQVLADNRNTLDIAYPMMVEQRLVGWVRVVFSKESMNRETRSIVLWGTLAAAVALAIGLALARIAIRALRRANAHLLAVAEAFKEGNENIRANTRRNDELEKLGEAINAMLDTIVSERHMAEEAQVNLDKARRQCDVMAISLQEGDERLKAEVEKRRRVENSLSVEEERLATTLSAIAEGVIVCDQRGVVTLMNIVAEKLTGWSLAEARGREAKEVFRLLEADATPLAEYPLSKAMDEGQVLSLPADVFLLGRHGVRLPVSGTCSPIRGQAGQPLGGISVFHDSSAEEAMRERMFKTRKLESLALLASGLAHDFNNILTSILGNIVMARPHAAANGALMLRDAEKAIQRAKRLTEQLLTFAKGGEPVRQSAQIEEVIRETCQFALAGSRVRARFEIPPDISWVYMDSGQISQVIQNIVLNAAQGMGESGGEIRVSCANCHIDHIDYTGHISRAVAGTTALPKGDYVQVSFTDDGPGIPAKNLGRVFDPYFTTKQTGHGLGLAICHAIIRKHNGHIDVISPAPSGKGTMLTFWLPVSREAPHAATIDVPASEPATGTILVMDDDEIIREVLGKMLGSVGYTVLFATEGREAIALYGKRLMQGQPIDCVILDLTIQGGMGGKNAMEAILRLDPQARGIVASGYVGDPVVAEYQKHGFAGAISKPFGMDELLGVVQRVLAAKPD